MNFKKPIKKDVVSYRNKHYIAIAAVICITIAQIFALEGFWKILVYAGFAFVVGTLVGTYEEKDELTNENLLKATEFTFFIVLGALFISAVIVENLDWMWEDSSVAVDLFYYILLGGVGLRSIIFLYLDIIPTLKSDDKEAEEVQDNETSENPQEIIDLDKIKAELKEQIKSELQQEINNTQDTLSEKKVEEIVDTNVEISEKPKTRKRKAKDCEEE